jgi:hypothetical protein
VKRTIRIAGWLFGVAIGVVVAAPSRAGSFPTCGWVTSVQDWSGSLDWTWGHEAEWAQLPDSTIHATVQDAGGGTFDLTGSFGAFHGDVDGQLDFDDYLQTEDLDNDVTFQRTVLTGPIIGPFPGDQAQMLLMIDPTACTYTWQMTPYADGTFSTESFSDATDGYPSNILPGSRPIPAAPGPLTFSGPVPVTTNPQVGAVDPQFATNANAAFASVGHAPFQPASVSWVFEPGNATVPLNDTCAGATFLFGNDQQDVSFATIDASEPAPSCGGGDRSVWFFFVASTSGTAQISTAGSGYSTVVSVSPMTPSCAALAGEVACGSDGADVPVQANTAYRVQVRRSGGAGTGDLHIGVTVVPEPSTAALAAFAALAQIRRSRPRQ